MTEVLHPTYSKQLLNDLATSLETKDYSKQVAAKEMNIGQLIANTYLLVETASQRKAHLKLDELEGLQKKLSSVTTFLSKIETELAKGHMVKTISLTDDHELVRQMHELTDIPTLKDRTSWTREEAESLRSSLTRHSQLHMQKVQGLTMSINRVIEEGTEMLSIARKCLEMLHTLLQTFTSNQRSR